MKELKIKNLSFKVEDLDSNTRTVKVALSKFGNVDSDGDILASGAFKKSIMERGPKSESNRKIKFLRYHDWEKEIGKWTELYETEEYLIGVGELGRSTKGNDAFLDYQDGIITEHSIGFSLVNGKYENTEEGFLIKEAYLWEGSAVTFGANEETPVLGVSKSLDLDYIDRLNKKYLGLVEAIKNGKGSDERLEQIEMNLKVCQHNYNSIIKSLTESVKPTQEQKPNEVNELLKQMIINSN
jgi:hypothetical protein